mmetsp:Transcript_26349/g.61108  ORF Transcript_26349/g.61108 Transcript_26349/m.61108 type:complete len:305 (+) Transcript_26349:2688-3602(+)
MVFKVTPAFLCSRPREMGGGASAARHCCCCLSNSLALSIKVCMAAGSPPATAWSNADWSISASCLMASLSIARCSASGSPHRAAKSPMSDMARETFMSPAVVTSVSSWSLEVASLEATVVRSSLTRANKGSQALPRGSAERSESNLAATSSIESASLGRSCMLSGSCVRTRSHRFLPLFANSACISGTSEIMVDAVFKLFTTFLKVANSWSGSPCPAMKFALACKLSRTDRDKIAWYFFWTMSDFVNRKLLICFDKPIMRCMTSLLFCTGFTSNKECSSSTTSSASRCIMLKHSRSLPSESNQP